MRRRTLLRGLGASAAIAASAGCVFGTGGGNGLRMEPVERFAHFAATQSNAFTEAQAALVDTALQAGEYVTYGYQPFPDDSYVEVDGTFYQVEVTRTGTKRMARTVLGAERVPEEPDEAVSVEAYPEPDREPVVFACRMAIARERRTPDERDDPTRYVVVFRTRSPETTTLLPDPEHPLVTYDERTFRLWTEERELEEDEYQSELRKIAGGPMDFRKSVEPEFVIDLDAHTLSSKQRDIIEAAATSGEYTEPRSSSSAFDELIDLLREEAPRRESLIKYEGEYYTWSYWYSE